MDTPWSVSSERKAALKSQKTPSLSPHENQSSLYLKPNQALERAAAHAQISNTVLDKGEAQILAFKDKVRMSVLLLLLSGLERSGAAMSRWLIPLLTGPFLYLHQE